jgi:hypothetical protein
MRDENPSIGLGYTGPKEQADRESRREILLIDCSSHLESVPRDISLRSQPLVGSFSLSAPRPASQNMADQNEVDLDSVIDRLLEVRGSRPGKQVQLLEAEIRYLCTKAREIFISQPILLELEAPIKVGTDLWPVHGKPEADLHAI